MTFVAWMRSLTVGLLAATCAALPVAQEPEVNVVYINGIKNTAADAESTRLAIETLLASSSNHQGSNRRSFNVEAIFNPTGWYGNPRILDSELDQDLKELFLLKVSEELFSDSMARILLPHNESRAIDAGSAEVVQQHLVNMMPGPDVTSLEAGSNPEMTEAEMAGTQAAAFSLAAKVRSLGSAVVVAHSQGNLLANLAWANLAVQYGNDIGSVMRVVNVANTSRFSVNGLNFTHAGDAALFSAATTAPLPVGDQSLQTLPEQKGWTRTTAVSLACSNANRCPFDLAQPTFRWYTGEIDNQPFPDNHLRHSIVTTYLNDDADVSAPLDSTTLGVPFTDGRTRFADRFEDFVYAAAESLRPWASIEPPAIAAGGHPVAVSAPAGSTVTFGVAATGSAPLIYQWRRDGMNIPCPPRGTCANLEWLVTREDDGARFDVVVSNARGSITSNSATVTVEPPAPPPVVGVPDLLPVGITSDAVSVEPGQAVSISVTVENRGLGSAQASSMLLQLSTDRDSPGTAAPWAELPIPPLSPGDSVRLVANGAAPSVPGSYYVWATVDSRGTAGQISDARSNDSGRITDPLVVQPAPPAGAVDLSPTITSIVQSRVAMGGPITIGFTVANSGRSDSLATTATVRLSPSSAPESTGPVLATVPIRSIAAGRSGLFSATFNAPFEPGIYRVQVEVDPSNVAGQGAGDRANDVVLSAGEVNVLTTGYPGGTPWEGAYEGSIAGGTYPAFRMYVLDSGEYWAFYGYIASTGSLNGGFFAQGNVSFGGAAFSSSDSLDFGFFPARAASVSGELNPTTRELSATANVAGANTTWAGLPLSRVIYDYAAPASLDSIAGAWGIQFNTGDRAVINVEAAGAFQAVSTGGCSMSGWLTPAPNGRNFFRLTVTFGGAPCLLAGQTTSGIAVRHSLSNGTPGIEFAVMTADRRGGAAGWGSR